MGYRSSLRYVTGMVTFLFLISTYKCLANTMALDDPGDYQGEENDEEPMWESDDELMPDDWIERMDAPPIGVRDARRSSNDVYKAAVDEHNKFRRIHGSPPVTADNNLNAQSQKYAEYLATRPSLEHSRDRNNVGENLAGSGKKSKADAVRDAISRWYKEVSAYRYDRPGYSDKTGHFTAVVWKNSRRIGVGVAWNKLRKYWIVVVRYSPSGNVLGQFPQNVLKKKRS